MRPPRGFRASWILPVLVALAAPWLSTRPAEAGVYAEGESILVTGTVTDAEDGRPLVGVDVALTGYRKSFDIWRLRPTKKGDYTARAVTGDDGRFEISWRWDKFYNRFELAAGVLTAIAAEDEAAPAAEPAPGSGETPPFLALAEAELSRRILQGTPVVASLVIEDTALLESWQGFLGTMEGPAQRRVYQELGKPDKVQSVDLPTHREVTWWYFEQGKVYRFREGEIESMDTFEPVPGS